MKTEPITRYPLAKAERAAQALAELLKPACRRIQIAGSIRRRTQDVKDIELVAEPIVELVRDERPRQQSLFAAPNDAPKRPHCRLEARLALLAEQFGRFRLGGGQRLVKLVYEGMPVDLFVCRPPAQFGCLAAIRTGPHDFSKLLVTPRSQGGARPDHLQQRDGSLWDGALQIETPHELQYFQALGVKQIAPAYRTAEWLRWELAKSKAGTH